MGRARRSLAWLAVAGALGGCLSAEPPTVNVPDLRGTWAGTWAGGPASLVVVEQDGVSAGGVSIGTVFTYPGPAPGVAGVLTFVTAGRSVSARVQGRLRETGRGLGLVLTVETTQETEELALTLVAPDRLTGTGGSSVYWGPRGPIELVRRPRP